MSMTGDQAKIARVNYRAGLVSLIAGVAIFVASIGMMLNCLISGSCSTEIQGFSIFNLANGVIVASFGLWQIRKYRSKKSVEMSQSPTSQVKSES